MAGVISAALGVLVWAGICTLTYITEHHNSAARTLLPTPNSTSNYQNPSKNKIFKNKINIILIDALSVIHLIYLVFFIVVKSIVYLRVRG